MASSSDSAAAMVVPHPAPAPAAADDSSAAPVTLYLAPLSQPCRAVRLLLSHCRVPWVPHLVSLFKREHDRPEFRAVNPLGEVPVLVEGEFVLAESHAILRYICSRWPEKVAEHWYPRGSSLDALRSRARIDAALDWHHCRLRTACKPFVRASLWPGIDGPSRFSLEELEQTLRSTMQTFNDVLLGSSDDSFLGGQNGSPSIADLAAVCEINMLSLTGFDWESSWPRIGRWASRVQDATKESWGEVHELYDRMVKENREKRRADAMAVPAAAASKA